jgi:peptidoglycan/LPS O-acetylase OafA/YrhL
LWVRRSADLRSDRVHATAESSRTTRRDVGAIVAGVIVLSVAGGYLLVMREEGDTPAAWFLVPLLVCGLLAIAAGWSSAWRGRPLALRAASAVLMLFGVLAILSIGAPLLVAAALLAFAAART